MRRILLFTLVQIWTLLGAIAANPYDNPDTIFVAKDGSGQFATVSGALEACRAFMPYHKVIFIRKGVYREKVEVHPWLTNIELCGEDAASTVITWSDHANIILEGSGHILTTFRTYTLKVSGDDITIRNLTVENNAPKLGQAVALHTEGDRLLFEKCRFLGNQDTVYTGRGRTRCMFRSCYIEGTTDFIFGPSTAWFEDCDILCKADSYITAASTPKGVRYGYVFSSCRIALAEGVTKVYLGRPWRPYAHTLFMNCHLPGGIVPEGWHNWNNVENERTARCQEYQNSGDGASVLGRVSWSKVLTGTEAMQITPSWVFSVDDVWIP